MTSIFLIMETVDLGGHPIIAYENKEKANEVCQKMQESFNNQKILDLLKIGYTVETATDYLKHYVGQYYVEEVEVI